MDLQKRFSVLFSCIYREAPGCRVWVGWLHVRDRRSRIMELSEQCGTLQPRKQHLDPHCPNEHSPQRSWSGCPWRYAKDKLPVYDHKACRRWLIYFYFYFFCLSQVNSSWWVASMALTLCVVLKCMTPPATNGGCWVACTRHAAMLVRPCSMMSSTLLAASMETTSSTRLKPTTLKQTSGAPVPMPSPIPKNQGPGNQMGAGGYLTQTNRLSDVIVLCDVLYVCGRVGGWVFEAWGWSRWVLLHRSNPWGWFFLQCLGGGGPLGVAESNIKPLHIAYFIFFFVVVYIVVSLFPF